MNEVYDKLGEIDRRVPGTIERVSVVVGDV
jgi:hypothetical protein